MKRDPNLHGLSSDHHHGLVLARRIQAKPEPALVAVTRRIFDEELALHFAVEEELMLPALRAAGEVALVERTEGDHAILRGHLAAAEAGDLERLAAFGEVLEAHIRFEERELFPAAEERLSREQLAEIGRRRPHDRI